MKFVLKLCLHLNSSLTNEPEMQGWLNTKTADGRIKFLLTDEIKMAIDRYVDIPEFPPIIY